MHGQQNINIHICFRKLYYNGSQSILTAAMPFSALVWLPCAFGDAFVLNLSLLWRIKSSLVCLKIIASYNITSEILITYFITVSFKLIYFSYVFIYDTQ